MPKKRDPNLPRTQFNARFPADVAARIVATADALSLDDVQLIRMIVREHLPEYERRAAAVRKAEAEKPTEE